MTSDLKRALETVAGTDGGQADAISDLVRARAAAKARTHRRLRRGLMAMTMATVVGVGAVLLVDRHDHATVAPEATAVGVELVAEPFEAPPYSFDLTPQGWSVQAQQPTAVTIAPDDGSTSSDPSDFRGKLVILFDTNPPTGRQLAHGERVMWVAGDSDYTILATRTTGAEPPGVVRIQYPADAGWDLDSMAAFLASVHVGPGARHGHG